MYEHPANFTLGFITCGVILTTVIFLFANGEGDMIYENCKENGIYIYADKKRIITCEVK
jgi:hypothetical protein